MAVATAALDDNGIFCGSGKAAAVTVVTGTTASSITTTALKKLPLLSDRWLYWTAMWQKLSSGLQIAIYTPCTSGVLMHPTLTWSSFLTILEMGQLHLRTEVCCLYALISFLHAGLNFLLSTINRWCYRIQLFCVDFLKQLNKTMHESLTFQFW